MLGEAALTEVDVDRYFQAYSQAIAELHSRHNTGIEQNDIMHNPSISVKLSALYPRFTFTQRSRAVPFLAEKLRQLAVQARQANIGLTMDAEEADRLEMSLEIFSTVFTHPDLQHWEGLGLAVQAYQKRALPVIDWLIELGREQRKRMNVRLVKGAYWDTEIKLTQMGGFCGYPVFTRKVSTDLSYLVCAKRLLTAQDVIYPQFATHNAYSVAAILTLMNHKDSHYDFEFQSLQGMGRALHDQLIECGIPCRIYGPVGSHEDLLPYLVRRLLENGANSSFINQIAHPDTPLEKLISNPVAKLRSYAAIPNPKIPLPKDIYLPRLNSKGLDLSDSLKNLGRPSKRNASNPFGKPLNAQQAECVYNPANRQQIIGHVMSASKADVENGACKIRRCFSRMESASCTGPCEFIIESGRIIGRASR